MKCDNKGKTVTLIKDTNGNLFGGFTSANWNVNGYFQKDTTAVLFTLKNPHNIPPTKFICSTPNRSIFCPEIYGPTFGDYDIYISDQSNSNNSSQSNFPNCYVDTTKKGPKLFAGQRNFKTVEIEVFQIVK